MAKSRAARILLGCILVVGCSARDEDDAAGRGAGREFATDGCRAGRFVAERPRPTGAFAFEDWRAPATTPIALLGRDAAVHGAAPAAAQGELIRFGADEIARWERVRVGDRIRIASPPLIPVLKDATRLEIVLHPAGVRSLDVVPSPVAAIDDKIRAFRGLSFQIDSPAHAGDPVTITADIETVLDQNWADDRRPESLLSRIEISLLAEDSDATRIEEIRIDGPLARYAGAAAGTISAELQGVVRPAWFVHGGRHVRIPVTVPQGEPVLSWHDGSVGGGIREVTVIDAAGGRKAIATEGTGRIWTRRELPLSEFAGRPVTIELRAEEPGVGLFGVPRIVSAEPRPHTPNVIVYLIDTLRADHLGAYGSEVPGVSPNLDRLAREGTLFGVAISSSSWTKPAIPTLMTGVAPTTHRVGATSYSDRLPEAVPLVQERFRNAGWRTGSFSASPLGSTLSGLERGFDTAFLPGHWRHRLGDLKHATAKQLHEALLTWQAEEPGTPFFAYVHTMEVHSWREGRYRQPPAGYRSYDSSVREADEALGALLAALAERGLGSNTLVIVVSDHGESFGDHGVRDHGTSLYQSQIQVPLLFWAGDALPPATVGDVVGLADVAPTLLDLVGLPAIEGLDGTSLAPYFRGPSEPLHDAVHAERIRYVWEPDAPQIHAIVTQARKKLIRQAADEQVFDLGEDACETRSLPDVPGDLRSALDAWLGAQTEAATAFVRRFGAASRAIDAEDVEQLKALGYVE